MNAHTKGVRVRFDGRIQFEGVPDELDVTVEVSDSHVRMLSGAEVLGSWCLADVVANRRVANEFEIELPEETVVFRADDQVNFAYGAVQKMAEGWARYHAMNAVRRRRAVGNARRQNEPSRLEAVKQALQDAGGALSAANASYVQQMEEPEPEPEVVWTPEPVSEPPARAEPTSGFWAKVREATAVDAGAAEPIPPSVGTPEPETDSEAEEVERVRANLRRRGLPRLDALPRRPEPIEFEPVEPEPTEHEPDPPPESEPTIQHEPVGEEEPAPWVNPVPDPVSVAADPEPAAAFSDPAPAREEDPAAAHNGSAATQPAPVHARRAARRLGAFGDGHHPAETSGIRATMRSVFSRSKTPHEHSFVETTTAAGLTRRLCLECGQVSIGVTHSEG